MTRVVAGSDDFIQVTGCYVQIYKVNFHRKKEASHQAYYFSIQGPLPWLSLVTLEGLADAAHTR